MLTDLENKLIGVLGVTDPAVRLRVREEAFQVFMAGWVEGYAAGAFDHKDATAAPAEEPKRRHRKTRETPAASTPSPELAAQLDPPPALEPAAAGKKDQASFGLTEDDMPY